MAQSQGLLPRAWRALPAETREWIQQADPREAQTYLDALSGGARMMSAGLLGSPADLAGQALALPYRLAGADVPEGLERPFLGSGHIGYTMERAGLLPEETGSFAELAGGILGPGGASQAPRVARAARPILEQGLRNVSSGGPATGGRLSQVGAVNPRMPGAGKPGLLSNFPTTTPGRIRNQIERQGGYSVNLPTGNTPSEGLMMGVRRNTDPRNTVVSRPITKADIESAVKKNAKALEQPEMFLGGWLDQETGRRYVEASRRFNKGEVRKATKFGERTGQKAGFDIDAGDEFPVGRWDDFIESPEFHGRLDELAAEGRTYLGQHPSNEWWDMHGTSFERVYGPENLPQVAGFTASTAPNTAPIENLQTMSEYMRRHLKGESAVQPGWRIPEGTMSRQPGTRIGMEGSRAANLRKSAEGRLSDLRRNKVREEAQALMGDPDAAVFDRHWARVSEAPERGIFAAAQPGILPPGRPYDRLKEQVMTAATRGGRDLRDFSADVWTGIRERIKNTSELYGTRFRGSSITGESKSYSDHFEDLLARKARHMNISQADLEKRLRTGDANLLSWVIATPLVATLLGTSDDADDGV